MKLLKVSDGPFAYEPGASVTYKGEPVSPGRLPHLIMGLLMSAKGEVVRWNEFSALYTYATLDSCRRNSVKVTVHHLRKRLREMGAPAGVIQTVQGAGLRWDRTAMEREAG